MTGLRREVALLALPVLTLLGVVVCHLIHADAATSTWITAAFAAAGTVVVTALAVPRHPQAIGGTVITLFTILAHYWWHLDTDISQPSIVVLQLLFGIGVSLRITPAVPVPPQQPPAA